MPKASDFNRMFNFSAMESLNRYAQMMENLNRHAQMMGNLDRYAQMMQTIAAPIVPSAISIKAMEQAKFASAAVIPSMVPFIAERAKWGTEAVAMSTLGMELAKIHRYNIIVHPVIPSQIYNSFQQSMAIDAIRSDKFSALISQSHFVKSAIWNTAIKFSDVGIKTHIDQKISSDSESVTEEETISQPDESDESEKICLWSRVKSVFPQAFMTRILKKDVKTFLIALGKVVIVFISPVDSLLTHYEADRAHRDADIAHRDNEIKHNDLAILIEQNKQIKAELRAQTKILKQVSNHHE